MANPEREAHIRPPIFDGSNFTHWKIRTTTYLQSLGAEVWGIIEGGYKFPSAIPTDAAERKQYELNAKVVTVLLGSLTQSEFMKVMHFKSAFHVVELVTTLLDAFITKERCLKKVIEVIIPVIKVMIHPIMMKTLDFSWHMKIRT